MKVLFLSYSHVGTTRGGMYQQIMGTARGLEEIGVEVIFGNPWQRQISDVDICHIFAGADSVYNMALAAKTIGVPVVWSTVLNVFDKRLARLRMEQFLSERLPGLLPGRRLGQKIFEIANVVVALNREEAVVHAVLFGPESEDKTRVIPNGFDSKILGGDGSLFRSKYQLNSRRIIALNVAHITPIKNQLSLVRAAKRQDWDLFLVGKHGDDAYSQRVIEESRCLSNVSILGELPYAGSELKNIYAAADVFCLPSFSEVQPISLIEAASNGCRLVASENVPIDPLLEEYVLTHQVTDVRSIQSAINQCCTSPGPPAGLVTKFPTWQDIATRVHSVYRELLK